MTADNANQTLLLCALKPLSSPKYTTDYCCGVTLLSEGEPKQSNAAGVVLASFNRTYVYARIQLAISSVPHASIVYISFLLYFKPSLSFPPNLRQLKLDLKEPRWILSRSIITLASAGETIICIFILSAYVPGCHSSFHPIYSRRDSAFAPYTVIESSAMARWPISVSSGGTLRRLL